MAMKMEDVVVEEVIDQPRIKRVKYSGNCPVKAMRKLKAQDATIQKRAPLHPSITSSTTRRNQSGRQDDEAGLCIYLTRQSSLPHVTERIAKALEDGKNSKSVPDLSNGIDEVGME